MDLRSRSAYWYKHSKYLRYLSTGTLQDEKRTANKPNAVPSPLSKRSQLHNEDLEYYHRKVEEDDDDATTNCNTIELGSKGMQCICCSFFCRRPKKRFATPNVSNE